MEELKNEEPEIIKSDIICYSKSIILNIKTTSYEEQLNVH